MKKSLLLVIAIYSLCLLNGCGSGSAQQTKDVATHFSVVPATSTPTAGTAFNFTVSALDASNGVVTSYAGMVHFTSTDPQAVLPANSTLTNGMGTFSATLNTSGSQTLTATDIVTPTLSGVSNTMQVSSAALRGTFAPTGSMEFPRGGHTATLLQDGTVLITGGENSTGPLATAEIFNPHTGMFTSTKGTMETARVGHTATLLTDGTVLITGGSDAAGGLATAEIFDPATGMFTPTNGNMETARVGHTGILLSDGTGRVLVAGGGIMPAVLFGPVTGGGSTSAELFNPKSGQFTPAGDNMLASRIYQAGTILSNGEVLLEGGTDSSSGSDLGDLFSPANVMFTATVTGGTTAVHLAAALLTDGSVLFTGGELEGTPCGTGGSLISLKNALLFTSGSGSFAETGDMTASRVSHTATLLSGGEVLVAGGATSTTQCDRGFGTSKFNAIASAELFDPTIGNFAITGNMTTARAGHTATLLGNGQVLVVGGVDANGNTLASAELFQ
jgi:large repetitive protein